METKSTASVWTLVLAGLVLALVFGAGLSVWLLGRDRVMTLALILIICLGLAVVIGASSLPIRAYRRRDMTGETHYVHDGTRTVVKETKILDGRAIEAPKIYQLPAAQQGGAFPEILRAAFQAGALAPRGSATQEAPIDAEVRELTADGWDGDIMS